MPQKESPLMKSVTINVVANGYQVYGNPKCGPSQTFVFETFDSLSDWLDDNLEVPGRCMRRNLMASLSGQWNAPCPTVGSFDYWAAP